MLSNNLNPPRLRLLALEATEPAEEAMKRSITRYKLNNKVGKLPYALPYVLGERLTREFCARLMDFGDDNEMMISK